MSALRWASLAERTMQLDVGSPFDYEANALLYCAAHLPDPRADGYAEAVADELTALIEAAGGRTLALFTSYRAMEAALGAVPGRVSTPVLAQGQLPKPALIEAFAADESASLFATMGFWQGIDVPGRTLSCVVVDRLPFPRPDDPLLQFLIKVHRLSDEQRRGLLSIHKESNRDLEDLRISSAHDLFRAGRKAA